MEQAEGPGVLRELEGGGRSRKLGPVPADTASPGAVLGFYSMGDNTARFKKLLFLARYYCFVSQRLLVFSSHASVVP